MEREGSLSVKTTSRNGPLSSGKGLPSPSAAEATTGNVKSTQDWIFANSSLYLTGSFSLSPFNLT